MSSREPLQRQGQEAEAMQRCSAFRITEGGCTEYFRVDGLGALLKAAQYVQRYQQEKGPFAEKLRGREQISADTFERMALDRFSSPNRGTEVFDINCDKQEFSAVRFLFGWVSYRMGDVSDVLQQSSCGDTYDWEERQTQVADLLVGREISSAGHLSAEDMSLAEEIREMDGHLLNFYLETNSNVEAALGTHVCIAGDDNALNIYANYDMASGQVCDMLEAVLLRADGGEEFLEYRLNAVEKAALLWKMKDYCQQQTGLSLQEYSAQRMAEEMAASAGELAGPWAGNGDVNRQREGREALPARSTLFAPVRRFVGAFPPGGIPAPPGHRNRPVAACVPRVRRELGDRRAAGTRGRRGKEKGAG